MEMIIILALAFGAMWLMTSRTRKQQREAADFRANLEVGQEVMTGSGLYGTIVAIDGDTITLESTPGNETRWIRAAIAKLVPPTDHLADDDEEYDSEEYDAEEYDAEQDDAAQYDGAQDDEEYDTQRHGAGAYAADADAVTRDSAAPGARRLDVPDDLSTLGDRRHDDGTNPR